MTHRGLHVLSIKAMLLFKFQKKIVLCSGASSYKATHIATYVCTYRYIEE